MYRNDAVQITGHGWLGVRLIGRSPNTDGLGAWIELTDSEGRTQVHEMQIPSHYLSTSPAERIFGLGGAQLQQVALRWPDGQRQVYSHLRGNRWLLLAERGADSLFEADFE
jgi:hypothetical protein